MCEWTLGLKSVGIQIHPRLVLYCHAFIPSFVLEMSFVFVASLEVFVQGLTAMAMHPYNVESGYT